jgi:hypothetical protein
MNISREQLEDLNGLVEDVSAHFCNTELVSGETFWTCVECLSVAKLAQIRGEVD